MKIKYYIYARKSSESEDRQVQSIDDQVKVLQKLATERGLEVVKIFTEAKSAKEPGREVFNQMLIGIQESSEVQGIICWKLDRLARNPIDGGKISWMLQKGIIKHIQSSDRSYYPEDNVLLMSVEQGMANQFIRDLSKNTKRGLLQKVERGWYPAQPTLGYLHNPLKRKGEKEIIKDPNNFHLVRKMFDLMLSGTLTPPQILKIATEEWGLRNRFGNKISRSGIYAIFTNIFYYGVFEYPAGSGDFYKGAHEPIITQEEFNRVQMLLGRHNRQRPKEHTFAYTGLIKCKECGAAITAEHKNKVQKNGNAHKYIYYHCTKRVNPNCTQKVIEEKELNEQIKKHLDKIHIPKEFIQWAIEQIKSEHADELEKLKAIRSSQLRELTNTEKNLERLLELRLNGDIEDEDYNKKRAELQKKRELLKLKLNEGENKLNSSFISTGNFLQFANAAREKFEKGSQEQRRIILSTLGSNLWLYNKKLVIQAEKPFSYLEEIKKEGEGLEDENNRFEPVQVHNKKRTYRDFTSISPVGLREQDSNLQPFG